jgi:sugar phosphate permease
MHLVYPLLVDTVDSVYAIRFLIALIEACTFSGSHYLLASWYKSEELGKRAGLFACSAQLGSLFSGASVRRTRDAAEHVHLQASSRVRSTTALTAIWVVPAGASRSPSD